MNFCSVLLLFSLPPSIADLAGFPDRGTTRTVVLMQSSQLEHLRDLYPASLHEREVRARIADLERRYRVWDQLDNCWAWKMNGDVRKLKELLGDEAFWTKRMPEPFSR